MTCQHTACFGAAAPPHLHLKGAAAGQLQLGGKEQAVADVAHQGVGIPQDRLLAGTGKIARGSVVRHEGDTRRCGRLCPHPTVRLFVAKCAAGTCGRQANSQAHGTGLQVLVDAVGAERRARWQRRRQPGGHVLLPPLVQCAAVALELRGGGGSCGERWRKPVLRWRVDWAQQGRQSAQQRAAQRSTWRSAAQHSAAQPGATSPPCPPAPPGNPPSARGQRRPRCPGAPSRAAEAQGAGGSQGRGRAN